jgi:two-component system, NarL family, sensor histidine kinase UhpB
VQGGTDMGNGPHSGRGLPCHPHCVSLFWRVVTINGAVLVVAACLLVFSPATVSATVAAAEVAVLAAGLVVVMAVNVVLLRRVFGPLERLARLMRRVDPMSPGRRIDVEGAAAEVDDLLDAFNEMLDRLERERRESALRALAAQERERRRLARELHDELGQNLTGLVLQLEGLGRAAPRELQATVDQVQETARQSAEEVRDIARGLRPQALDEFGLRSALITLATGFAERSGLQVRHELAPVLPELAPEQDLAVYRIAQEGLTNVARHAEATGVLISLVAEDGQVVLRVRDDGRGIDERAAHNAGGLGGMRERAMLIGGRLVVTRVRPSGTEVLFELPVENRS